MTLRDRLGPTLLAERFGPDLAWMLVEAWRPLRLAEQARHGMDLLDALDASDDQQRDGHDG